MYSTLSVTCAQMPVTLSSAQSFCQSCSAGHGAYLQVLLMSPGASARFVFQMTQAGPYYGGQGNCQFNTTVDLAVRYMQRSAQDVVLVARPCSPPH